MATVSPPSRNFRRLFRDIIEKVYLISREALLTFSTARGTEAAASIAYYTLFAIFPMIFGFAAIGSFFVEKQVVETQLLELLPRLIPVSQEFIISNVQQVFDSRGTVSVLALIGLFLSASAVFTTIIRNINAAWREAAPRSYLRMKLWSLAIIGVMAVLLIASSFSIPVKNLIINLGLPIDFSPISRFLASGFYNNVLPILFRLFLFFGLYYWVPQIKVNKKAAITGAVVSTLLWQLITLLFTTYLTSGLARYEIIYGSLGKIIALLVWVYLSGWIILFGAHLTSSIDGHLQSAN